MVGIITAGFEATFVANSMVADGSSSEEVSSRSDFAISSSRGLTLTTVGIIDSRMAIMIKTAIKIRIIMKIFFEAWDFEASSNILGL
jgi:hypothetical protein